MLDNIGLIAAYAGVGLILLAVGFYVLDILTGEGSLGEQVMNNANAALVAASSVLSLGLILWFAIFFTGAGWHHLDDVAVYGGVAIVIQAIGFKVLDLLTPGSLGDVCRAARTHAGAKVVAAMNVAVALIVAASLT